MNIVKSSFIAACLSLVAISSAGATSAHVNKSATLAGRPAFRLDSFLLGSPQVRKELGLSHSTAVRVLDLLNYAAYLNRGGLMTTAESETLEAERKKNNPEVLQRRAVALLSSEQQNRLAQIGYQRGGPFVFNDAWIVQKIGVSATQQKQIESAQKQILKSYSQSRNASQPVGEAQVSDAVAAAKRENDRITQQCRTALLRILTPIQQSRWKALLGTPFSTENIRYDVRRYPMD